MTEGEVREYLALLDGPRCGKAWSAKPDRRTVVEGLCDYPAGHDGNCGHEQNRTDPWVGIVRMLLAELDNWRTEAVKLALPDIGPAAPFDKRTLADVVAWLRKRRDGIPEDSPPAGIQMRLMLGILIPALEAGAPWRASCDGTPAEFPGRS